MAPELSRLVRRVTWLLLILSAAAVEIAAAATRPPMLSLGLAAICIGIALGLGWFIPAPADPRSHPPKFVFGLLLVLAAAPFAFEPLRRVWSGDGYSLELQMVLALRNLGLGLAACGGWLLCLRLACVVSLFLTLFSAAMTSHPAVISILGAYTAAGSVWLMLVYWIGLRHVFVGSDHAVAMELQPDRVRMPRVTVFIVLGLLASVLSLVAIGPRQVTRTLGEWLATSGGTGAYDPFARGGVNDGDDETSGSNAKSTGMIKSDTFLDSPLPSLYDMFNDMYGEPFKPKEQERAIAFTPSTNVVEPKKRPADNLRPNRDFPTTRTSPRKSRDPLSRSARAIFEVRGRTPLHVRVAAYDAFDGWKWQESPFNQPITPLDKEPRSNWMKICELTAPAIFAEPDAHEFKVTAPEGSLIPTPPHLVEFRIGRVDRPDFFAWGQDRILRFADRKTPSGIVVETESRSIAPEKLAGIEFPRGFSSERLDYCTLPGGLNPRLVELARAWTAEIPAGWPQITAIVNALRSEFQHDPAYSVPVDCADPLGHFLLEARRGPDYQFSTAAAILLRALGYPTRIVSGFYVDPAHYDPETEHTPVVADDIHFWPEVMLRAGNWLVLEPTPGYEVLGPNLSLWARLGSVVVATARWFGRHWLVFGLNLILATAIWLCRRAIFDALAVRLWRWWPGRTWREQVRRGVRVLDRRGRWAGRPRESSRTVAAWLRDIRHDADVQMLATLSEWAAYAPATAPPCPAADALSVCRRVIGRWTLTRWQSVEYPSAATGA